MTDSVTVVVPTHARPEPLAACVAAIHAATDAPLLVVEDAHGTGASWARNQGLERADTDLVAFVDDDVRVTEAWLPALLAPFVDPDVVAVVGPVELDCRPARPRWLTEPLAPWFSALDLGDQDRDLGPAEYGWSANLAVRRAAALAAGGFDVTLGPGTRVGFGDDTDLLDRLRAAGGRVAYGAGARVRHEIGPERLRYRWLAGRCCRQGRADVVLTRPADDRRHVGRAVVSLAGALRWGVPALARTLRDPARRAGAVGEQVAIWTQRAGAAVEWCSAQR